VLCTHSRKKAEHLTSSLWIAQVGIEDSSRQVTSGKHYDHSPKFSSNSKNIAFLSDRDHPGEGCSLFVLPFTRCGEARPLTKLEADGDISAFCWSSDGNFVAFISPDSPIEGAAKGNDTKVYGEKWDNARLRVVNTQTQNVTTLSAQNTHVYDFAWNDDSTHLVYATTATPEFASSYINGTTVEVSTLRSKAYRVFCKYPTRLYDLAWLGSNLFWRSIYDQQTLVSSNCVHGMSMTDKTWARQLGGETDCIYK
jgi:tricorn protease-like protein